MNRIENLVDLDKLNELRVSEPKKLNKLLGKEVEEKKERNILLWVLAIIGAVVAVAAVTYAVYRFFFAQDYGRLLRMTSKMKQMTWKRMMTTSSRMKENQPMKKSDRYMKDLL